MRSRRAELGEEALSSEQPHLDLEGFVRAVEDGPADDEFRPWMVKLMPGQGAKLRDGCEARGIRILDPIDRQLEELAAIRLPAGPAAERKRFIEHHVGEAGDGYGSWVYVPWERKIVHLLDGDDYFDVVVSRNHDKITREEQALLRTKRIGVLGLSVGGEAAVTLAQEHLCGEMRLADFDRLDLSNLNRLGAGFDQLGENKARIAARRIATIDPYLKVTVFDGGVTDDNVLEFLGGLDLLVEECDDLQMKREIRRHTRAMGIDVVYAADERGFLSVEPYASDPELRPFHGLADAPQPRREDLEPLAFMKALTEWLGGWNGISERSRRSLESIGKTLCGYPQLASEARFAAGQIGHVARRLLLGEKLKPYVGTVDLSEMVESV